MNSSLDRRLERLETALGDSEMVKVTLSPEVREMIEQVSGMPCEEVSYVSAALANTGGSGAIGNLIREFEERNRLSSLAVNN